MRFRISYYLLNLQVRERIHSYMAKRNRFKAFWKKMRSKYKLSFFNENTLEEVWTFRLSRLGAFLFFSALVIIIFSGAMYLIVGTPLKNYLPGYLKTETRVKIMDNALRIDSLNQAMQLNDAYLKNLTNILTGNVKIDSIRNIKDSLLSFPTDSFLTQSLATTSFMQRYEEEEKYKLNVLNQTIPTDGFIFFAPIKGVIKQKFNPENNHFGIDILAPKRVSVAATLDGTVISAGDTVDYGYVIEIQHSNNFISIYKYNAELLKSIGDKVSGGEVIALTGNGTKESFPPLVEFQLWHMGQALNPEDYIAF